MSLIPRYRHVCKGIGCGANMLRMPKNGLCGDCESKRQRGLRKSIAEHTKHLQDLETRVIVLDHKDLFTAADHAEIVRLRGQLLEEYRAAWETVIGRPLIDLSKSNGVKQS